MNLIKIILFPLLFILKIIHLSIILMRNLLYDLNIYKKTKFKINIISVGSLKIGGAGKTPLVEYLIKVLNNKKIAILSRGYKRKTKGFIISNKTHKSYEIGDEPRQIKHNHPDLLVAVCENRVEGVNRLLEKNSNIKTVILDDGHQHRKIERDLNILVTEYEKLYSDDMLFPLGNLRDSIISAKRANIIVITKCPKKISSELKNKIKFQLSLNSDQKLFFSHIVYKNLKNIKTGKDESLKIKEKYFLLTGIGNSNPLKNYLKSKKVLFKHYKFPDHYYYKEKDIKKIILEGIKKETTNLILTEKDFFRLTKSNIKYLCGHFNLFYLKIEFDFNDGEKQNFNKQILKFI